MCETCDTPTVTGDYTTRRATAADRDALELLVRYELAEDLVAAAGTATFVTEDATGIVAVAVCHPLGVSDIAQLRRDLAGADAPTFAAGRTWTLAQLAVVPWRRGQRLGTTLVDTVTRHATSLGATTLVATAWRSGRNESFRLFVRAGYVEIATIDGYWHDPDRDTVTEPACATCNGPCACPATIVVKSLSR